ncbi:class I SAM-dependent methyltransferase [Neorhodopirellula pilleata]|uniref:16S ribosomal RNA methyltransferase KsgA/Dim1 family protein n=1 Tax=Neorhodopirellula pilleata TaxID=2714738 RepID=A0A5C6AQU2_9BACT|nr:SAM-dependent methyltransferase [Neorhodopirellula pilleata]TWU01352.1 16S ribosomal RNA methyltransferase KsgA/Dim1 family protein [Neorhodopirellula pilleata]
MAFTLERPLASTYTRRAACVFKAWLKQPTQVATIFPSSVFLTERIARRDCVRSADTVVELGPGAGGTTLALLESMKPDARLLAVEKTPDLADALAEIEDPRLTSRLGDAADLIEILRAHDLTKADVIVSGIPFSSIPRATAKRISRSIDDVLTPGGTFIAYQLRDDILHFTRPLFGTPHTQFVMRNLPPLRIFTWTKRLQG